MYQGADSIGYAHIQLWPLQRAAVRMIVIEEKHRGKNHGREFMDFIEKWLKLQGYKSVHTQSSPAALGFYKQRGFKPMPFKDPDGYESSPGDSAMGKVL